jgi:hypothetical protein
MKKKNLQTLRLKKSTVSSLNIKAIKGGTIIITLRNSCPIPFPQPQETVTTCSQFAECDSRRICTAAVCKTFELDGETRPIC